MVVGACSIIFKVCSAPEINCRHPGRLDFPFLSRCSPAFIALSMPNFAHSCTTTNRQGCRFLEEGESRPAFKICSTISFEILVSLNFRMLLRFKIALDTSTIIILFRMGLLKLKFVVVDLRQCRVFAGRNTIVILSKAHGTNQ